MNRVPYTQDEIDRHQAQLDRRNQGSTANQIRMQQNSLKEARYSFPVVIGQKGYVCKIGRRIGQGSFGYVHEADII